MRHRGFSLIELLICVLVIGVLIALALPALSKSREAARSVVCLSNLHNLHVSTRIYADDHRTFPVRDPSYPVPDLEMPMKLWCCPTEKVPPQSMNGYSSYTYLPPIYMDPPPEGLILSRLNPRVAYRRYEANPGLPLFWDREAMHSGDRNIVYWDGRAARRHWN